MPIIQPSKNNSLEIKKFVFSKLLSAKLMPKRENTIYKDVRLVEGSQGWYISYYFRIPPDLPAKLPVDLFDKEWMYKGVLRKWARFRYKEELNRIGTLEYREQRTKDVKKLLDEGFDPFEEMVKQYEKIKEQQFLEQKAVQRSRSLRTVTEEFLKTYKKIDTRRQYEGIVRYLHEYFTSSPELPTDSWFKPITEFTTEELEGFLNEYKEEKGWSSRTFNDKVDKVITTFSYAVKKRYIIENPAKFIQKETPNTVSKHKYYDDDFAPIMKQAMLDLPYWGRYLHNFCEMIFYTCTRPKKETRQLKVGDILWDRNAFQIRADIAKGGYGGIIHMGPELTSFLTGLGLKEYPKDYYIFGKEGPPGAEPVTDHFFEDIFRVEVRDKKGYDKDYTLYGWKHRRAVKMFMENAPVAAIQQLCRHQNPTTTEKYLRALGCELGTIRHNAVVKF